MSYELNDAITLAGGAEYREETFEIEAGQIESWDFGPLAAQGFSAASNGFPGFSDTIAGSWSRANYALYGAWSWRVTDPWQVDFAVRWEDFRGFRHDHERQGRDELSLQRRLRDPRQLEHRIPGADARTVECIERDDAV